MRRILDGGGGTWGREGCPGIWIEFQGAFIWSRIIQKGSLNDKLCCIYKYIQIQRGHILHEIHDKRYNQKCLSKGGKLVEFSVIKIAKIQH